MNRTAFAWTLAMLLSVAPAWAQRGHGGGKPQTPHGSPAPHGSQAPKATKPAGAHGPKSTAHGNSGSAATKGSGHSTPKTTKTTGSAKATGTSPRSSSSTLSIPPSLGTKLQSRLPAGTNLDTASTGFRNLGQFVAAVNVSNNLGIPFTELKTRMVDRDMSLGRAIQDARPSTTDTTVIVRRAEQEANEWVSTATPKKKPKSGR